MDPHKDFGNLGILKNVIFLQNGLSRWGAPRAETFFIIFKVFIHVVQSGARVPHGPMGARE